METSECLNLLREVRDCAFATIDKDGQPAVRIIDVMLVEGERLYFCTARYIRYRLRGRAGWNYTRSFWQKRFLLNS